MTKEHEDRKYIRIRCNYKVGTATITKRGRDILDSLIESDPETAFGCLNAINNEIIEYYQRAKAAQRAMKERARSDA